MKRISKLWLHQIR